MEFRILGPLEVVDQGRRLPLGAAKQRALLAVLLLHANEVVSSDRLIDGLWGDQPPETAAKVVQVYVSQLRKALGEEGRVLTRAPGYLLRTAPEELDLQRFEDRFESGRRALAAGDARLAAGTLSDALALWRGPPLADFAFEPFAQVEIARLEERRLLAAIERIDADLELGRHADLVAELEAFVAAHPLQERLRGQLMLALYRSGRQAEALQAYQDGRQVLASELGLEPSPALRRLEQAILTQDATLEPPRAAPPAPEAGPESPAEGSAAAGEDEARSDVTFPELVWEHFRWERERSTAGAATPATEAAYRSKLAGFEARQGTIVEAYWCQHAASAAALTVRRPTLLRRLLGADPRVRVHRVSDWISRDAPEIAELLFRCDALALEAEDALRRAAKDRAFRRLYSAQTNLLGLLERSSGRPSEAQTLQAARQTRELLARVESELASAGVPRRERPR
jgi:DNA-binding SARP family transcriptional activator